MKKLKKQTFQNAINEIKKLGFDVYIPKDDDISTYGHFTDGQNIGYFQVAYFFPDSIQLSSINKPNIKTGTGFQIIEAINPFDLTKDDLLKTLNFRPNYDYGKDFQKYSLAEWLKDSWSGQRAKKV